MYTKITNKTITKNHYKCLSNSLHSQRNYHDPFAGVPVGNCRRLPSHWSRAGLCRITRLSFGCHHTEKGLIQRKMVVDCPKVITSIGDTLFQTRLDQELVIIDQASLLFVGLVCAMYILHLGDSKRYSFSKQSWLVHKDQLAK